MRKSESTDAPGILGIAEHNGYTIGNGVVGKSAELARPLWKCDAGALSRRKDTPRPSRCQCHALLYKASDRRNDASDAF